MEQLNSILEGEAFDEIRAVVLLKPRIFKDGAHWCCLYGDNLQSSDLYSFGDTPYNAARAFNKFYHQGGQ